MNVLLIGSGGREHCMAQAMLESPKLASLHVAPGNPGTAAHNVDLDVNDHDQVVAFCREHAIDLVVVGPEVPLVAGIADALGAAGVGCFGPSAAAAQLEGSKSFAREFADEFGIPSIAFARFSDSDDAIAWLGTFTKPVVVKQDGLAAGKGVVVPETHEETVAAIRAVLDADEHASVVLEERIYGEEVSLFGISDGTRVATVATAQDHKRVGEGDTGPNTGGMGAFAPVPTVDAALERELADLFLKPVVDGMAARGTPYVGVIFAGIMITADGPRLIEYNCRFGDPETQVIVPLLDCDLLEVFAGAASGALDPDVITMSGDTAATVVVAAEGYPASPRRDIAVNLPPAVGDTVTIFHAGTRRSDDGELVSSGGRVLAVTGRGRDLGEALDAAYGVVNETIGDGLFARRDIGWRHHARGINRSQL